MDQSQNDIQNYERVLIDFFPKVPPLKKMVEIVINKYQMYWVNNGDVKATQADTLAFLSEKLSYYSEEKGRAFSYFTIVARNYLIQRNRKDYKRVQQEMSISQVANLNLEGVMNIATDLEQEADEEFEKEDSIRFLELFLEWINENDRKVFPERNARDLWRIMSERIFRVMDENDQSFDKKQYYLELQKDLGLSDPQKIYYVVSCIRRHYRHKKQFWIENGYFDRNRPRRSYFEKV